MTEALTMKRIEMATLIGVPARTVLWEGTVAGLGLRVQPSGSASWIYRFKPQGSGKNAAPVTLTLGRWPTLGIAQARAAARVHAGRIALGADPAEEVREKKRNVRHRVGEVIDAYELHLEQRQIVNKKAMISALKRGLAPYASRDIKSLSRMQMVERIDLLESAGKPGAANDLRKISRTFMEFAVTKGLIAFNPLAGLRRPKASRADRLEDSARKGRALDDSEIKAVWIATGEWKAFRGLVRLGLLTGFRRGELAGLEWRDVRNDRIVVPAAKTKMGVAQEVPLTPLMRLVLNEQARTTSNLIFPSPRRTASVRLSGWSQLVADLVKTSGVNFRLHDLRRTCRTLMSRVGVSEEVAEMAIGHVKQGLVGLYNKDDLWARRVDAFERVDAHIAGVIADLPDSGKVTVLRLEHQDAG